jgi:type I restriction enzyme M protein
VTNSNKLTGANITAILDAYVARDNVDYFARLVPNAEIAEQDYNLSVSGYVAAEDKREAVNITALNAEIDRIVAREDALRREIAAIVAEIEGNQLVTSCYQLKEGKSE